MSEIIVDGVSAWATLSDKGATGITVTNMATDDTPSVDIYTHAGDVCGCLVRDGSGAVVAAWGLVDAEMAT